ncbi:protein nanos [Rhagoletis pomonella]|uniref:protein nanos n=1 Tax=Rhagoletis pomonella TaxID=28610 RepID=UPI001781BFC2|nr:protein nanos [Rhagoletis pomonella]
MLRTHNDADLKRDHFASFLEIGSLDVKCMQEMHLDTTSTFDGLKSISPSSLETSMFQLSPNLINSIPLPLLSSTPSPSNASPITMSQPQPHSYGYFNIGNGISVTDMALHSGFMGKKNIYQSQEFSKFDENFNIQHKEPYRTTKATLAQNQQKNEISKSLKMFAMLAACKYRNDPIKHDTDSLVDDVMQDFYCNGYVTDESNLYRHGNDSVETSSHIDQYYSSNNNYNNGVESNLNSNIINVGTSNAGSGNTIPNNHNSAAIFNPHCLNQNMWKLHFHTPSPFLGSGISSQAAQHHAATVAAAAANIEYNSQNIKKLQKRYGCTKFDKIAAVKHCVFCENNHEPEAVVKSHAVRDSLGRVLCPKLRTYVCPICKASGDKAHTVKYCPQKPIITMEDAVKAESLRLAKSSYYKHGTKA